MSLTMWDHTVLPSTQQHKWTCLSGWD